MERTSNHGNLCLDRIDEKGDDMNVLEFVLSLLYPDLLKERIEVENVDPLEIIKRSDVRINDGTNNYAIESVYYAGGRVCVDISIETED